MSSMPQTEVSPEIIRVRDLRKVYHTGGVDVEAPGYHGAYFSTSANSDNHAGWRGDNLDIVLQPAPQLATQP